MSRLVSLNLKFSNTPAQMKHDLLRVLQGKPGVVGLQEVNAAQAKGMRKFLAAHGYGISIVNQVPIVFDKKRFSLQASNSRRLTSGNLRPVDASWVALKDKQTGATNVYSNTHLIRGSRAPKLQAQQVRDLANLQRDLQKRFGKDANYFLTGDMNTASAKDLAPLTRAGLKLFRAPGQTGPKGGTIDWIASTLKHMEGSHVVSNIQSDHNAYVGNFNLMAGQNDQQGSGKKKKKDPPPSGQFTDAQKSAFDIMADLLKQYRLGILTPTLRQIILSGITDQAEIQLQLQQTDAWKTRFAGNELLRKAGLPVLSVAEYLATERSYAQAMKQYGLPAGFYDDPADFAKFIGNSVSPNEVLQRAQMYADLANREDPAIIAQLKSMGMSEGDLLAYMMNPGRAMPLLQQKYNSSLIGGAARRAGVTPDNAYVRHLAEMGVSEQAATQGYGEVAAELPGAQLLGSLYHDSITQDEITRGVFDNNAAAQAKTRRLASQERAAFSGSSGTGQGSLGRSGSGSY